MKTVDEWIAIWRSPNNVCKTTDDAENLIAALFKDIQSDAFHAGELKGLNEARKIVRDFGTNIGMEDKDFTAPPCESMEKK